MTVPDPTRRLWDALGVDEHDALLHRLRITGTTEASGLAADALLAAGLARQRPGRRGALVLTPAGRVEADVRFSLVGQPGHERVVAAYERFRPLNRLLLQICTDWQVRPGGIPNDHRDPVYDWGVIDRLVTLDEQAGPVARSLGRHIARFAPYRERMRGARARVEGGETAWLASPRLDSYHTVWMQWHEDLLLGLGRARAEEQAGDPPDG
jgi:hypothetical protein